jgi:hypothetical protein
LLRCVSSGRRALAKYIVLGFTSGRCSIELIDRYKGSEELRDIFVLSGDRLGRAVRRKLYIFEVCEEPRAECLYLISFDIKLVRVRDPKRIRDPIKAIGINGVYYKKPSHEYTEIREMLYSSLCIGGVTGNKEMILDNSTYLCFEGKSIDVENYLSERTDPDKFRVESYIVKPFRDVEKQLVINGLNYTLTWLEARALALASSLRNPRKRPEKRAEEFLNIVPEAVTTRVVEKLKALGIEQEQIERIISRLRIARKIVEDAYRERVYEN